MAVRFRGGESGSIQRPQGVLEIRIHQRVGWTCIRWAVVLFLQFLVFFMLCAPLIATICTPVHAKISYKIHEKIHSVFLMCFWLFSNIFTRSGLVEIIRVNFIVMRTFRMFL